MSAVQIASNITAPTKYVDAKNERYAYRRFGKARADACPLLLLQHFQGTLDNWDPAVTDQLATERDVILFDSAGVGGSSGTVPRTVDGMAQHALAFLQALDIETCDAVGYSLGGMVAQDMARDNPSSIRKMILVGTAPRGGEDVMHLDKPVLAKFFNDPTLQGYRMLQKIFFAPTESSQAAGKAFIDRLAQRKDDRDPIRGTPVAEAQIAAFRDWEQPKGERFADLKNVRQPTLVINGIFDEMISVRNSYWLAENLPNAVLVTYPDSGHGSLFQFHDAFTREAEEFLSSDSAWAPF